MLNACDVGHRVVVRHEVSPGRRTDLLGELVRLDEDTITIRTGSGVEQVVARGRVVAAKRVPPRPPRFSEMLDLERVADRAWPAPVHERLGEWYLRASGGWTARGNSALPVGDSGLPLPEAVEACRSWYAARGLRGRVTVPLPVRRDVADQLVAAGWAAQPEVLVQTARLTPDGTGEADLAAGVAILDRPGAAFLDLVAEHKGALPAAAEHLLTGVRPVGFAEARRAGELAAIARVAVVDGWMHLGLVQVVPSARRQGLARALYVAVARWAAGQGAERAVLQVEAHNVAAVTLYAGLGFTTHHRYVTYAAP